MCTIQGHERRGRWGRGMLGRFHRCEDGQAIYVVVLFLFLLAGLLFLVINTGEQLNRKVQMQSAADVTVATGATWFARGVNTIAACNVTETQLLSLIVLCDTLETVTPPAQECIDDLVQNIGASKAGRDIPVDQRLCTWLVVGNATSEQQIIKQFADIVKAINWPDYLTYDTGVMWECTRLLDGFSHAMMRDTPKVARREAIKIARKNGAEFGFMVPLWPELPVRDGEWQDFRDPMERGTLPPPHQGEIIQGFNRLMGYHSVYGTATDPRHSYGPWSYWREPFTRAMPMGLFDISRFSVPFKIVSETKLDMLFGSPDDQWTSRQWEMDYDKAKQVAPEDILNCWWEVSRFDARYAYDEEREPFPLPASGLWGAMHSPDVVYPSLPRPYRDMDHPDLSAYKRATQAYEGADPRQAVWYRCVKRRVEHYPALGIYAPHPPVYPDGTPWAYTDAEKHTIWHVILWRFNGLQKQTDETLHRKYLPPDGHDELKPIMFDDSGENTVANVRQRFTFNGFAYRTGAVKDWSAWFFNPNPTKDTVAYAEARVYNRYSWDTFTQHWKVKLRRADRWQELIPELDRQGPLAVEPELQYTEERIKPVRQTLEGYSDAFVREVTH